MTIQNPMFPPPLAGAAHVHSRRAILGGATAIATLAAAPGALARSSDDVQLNDLLRRWKVVHDDLRAAEAAEELADARLPWWARLGPMYLCHDGTFAGHENGWPAIENMERPPSPSTLRLIRPTPVSLKRDYEDSIAIWNAPTSVALARKRYHVALRALAERRRRQRAEKEKVGLPALAKRVDEAYEAREDLTDAIGELPPSCMSVAAMIMTSLGVGWGGGQIADRVLKHLAPALIGELADDVRARLTSEVQR